MMILSVPLFKRAAEPLMERHKMKHPLLSHRLLNYPLLKRLCLALALVLVASPGFAQVPAMGIPLNNDKQKTQDEIDRDKATEDAYKKTMKAIPNAKASNDPWGSIRSEDKKPAAAQPKTKKTGTTAAN